MRAQQISRTISQEEFDSLNLRYNKLLTKYNNMERATRICQISPIENIVVGFQENGKNVLKDLCRRVNTYEYDPEIEKNLDVLYNYLVHVTAEVQSLLIKYNPAREQEKN